MNEILQNDIKKYAKLKLKKYRDEYNLFVAEGLHIVNEAINKKIVKVILLERKYKNKIKFDNCFGVKESIIEKISDSKNPQGIIAICEKIKYDSKKDFKKTLVLNNISDPGNLGTLIRSAKSFNFDRVVFKGVDLYNPKVVRSSKGAMFSIPCFNIESEEQFLKNKKNVFGAMISKDSKKYYKIEYPENLFLVLGNETRGIDKNIQKYITKNIFIPINFESLNVSVAGSILMNHINNKK